MIPVCKTVFIGRNQRVLSDLVCYRRNTRKSFYAAHLAETKISTRNTRKSFNAAHLGGARACEAGFHPITPRRHDNKQRKQRRKKPSTKKETIIKENNEERNLQRRKKPSKKTTKKETFNEERNHQRRKKPTKKTKLVNDEGFIINNGISFINDNSSSSTCQRPV
ncbi:hypothetical protein JTB14_021644 [Gonioctena quinquepunctata]|nr:hypothetical protein JTB14_021644 [Gonioctena quinquepunctata]